MKNKFLFFVALSALFALASCTGSKGKNIPDVSHISVDLKIKRFEQDLFKMDTSDISKSRVMLDEKYPDFFGEVFLGKIIPPLQDPAVFELFVKSPGMIKLYDTCSLVYGNFAEEEQALEEAFQFYSYYFPERKIPEVITYISEYTLGNYTLEEEQLGIGLDFFLGKDYPLYNREFFPRYIARSMDKDHLLSKTMKTMVKNMVGEPEGDRLIDIMVNNGKVLYILDHLLPHTPDSIKLEFTAAQNEWCNNNELEMWAHFLKEELLYSTKRKDIRKLVEHSPNSPGMPPEAPGRTANWLGWQIVKSYFKRHPEASMEDLISLKDAQQLLNRSKYKPRR